MASRSPSGTLPGSPREAETDQLFAPRRPRGRSHVFFSPPGAPRDATKSDLKRSWRPLWAHMAPRGAPEASRPSFETLRAPSGSIFPSFLMIFRPSFLIRSVSCSCSFSLACSCSLLGFGRLRSLNFENWQPSIPEALGGRRGSRSDKNPPTTACGDERV